LDIAPDEMVESLYERLTLCASDLTLKVVREWDCKTVVAQDET
jgi:hypothetical protein